MACSVVDADTASSGTVPYLPVSRIAGVLPVRDSLHFSTRPTAEIAPIGWQVIAHQFSERPPRHGQRYPLYSQRTARSGYLDVRRALFQAIVPAVGGSHGFAVLHYGITAGEPRLGAGVMTVAGVAGPIGGGWARVRALSARYPRTAYDHTEPPIARARRRAQHSFGP